MFGFGSGCEIEFELDKAGTRKSVEVNEDGKKVKQLIYYDGEDVGGTVYNFIRIELHFSLLLLHNLIF